MEEIKFEDTQDAGLAQKAKDLAVAVLGKAYEEARNLVSESGCEMRLSSRDGESFPMTMDFRGDRVNLDLVDGKVTSASVN